MAIIARGHTPCVLCRQAIGAHGDVVAASHFIEHPNEVFAGFSDVAFHRSCFLRWPLRRAFIARFNTLAERCVRGGLVRHMQDDGGTIMSPLPDHVGNGLEPLVVSLLSSKRRQGVHAVLNPCEQPLERARLILSLHVPVPAGLLRALLSAQVRVVRIEHAGTLGETGQHDLSLRLLDAAPAMTLSASAPCGPGVHYVEAGDGGRDGTLLRPRAAFAVRVAGDCQAAALQCWAVQAGC